MKYGRVGEKLTQGWVGLENGCLIKVLGYLLGLQVSQGMQIYKWYVFKSCTWSGLSRLYRVTSGRGDNVTGEWWTPKRERNRQAHELISSLLLTKKCCWIAFSISGLSRFKFAKFMKILRWQFLNISNSCCEIFHYLNNFSFQLCERESPLTNYM